MVITKPLSFTASIVFSIAILFAGAVIASSLGSNTTLASDAVVGVDENSLTIELDGVRSDEGRLLVMIFDNPEAFDHYDYKQAVGYQETEARAGKHVFHFPSLNKGPYAVFAMHDENGDQQLNEEGGYPLEGFSISGARNKYHAPSFQEAWIVKGKYQLTLVYF